MKKKQSQHLWVGNVDICTYITRKLKVRKAPRIISEPEHLFGYQGPLSIHFCGDFWKLPKWEEIVHHLKILNAYGLIKRITLH